MTVLLKDWLNALLRDFKKIETMRNQVWDETVADILPHLTIPTIYGNQPIIPFPEWTSVLDSQAPIKLVVGGEGSGKSLHAALYLVFRSVYDLQWGTHLYWVVGADYEDARKDFDYFIELYSQIGSFQSKHISGDLSQQCTAITDTGHTIKTLSSYDFTKIARDEPFGILGAEVSRWFPETFARCEGRLLRNYPHSWGFFGGSPESSQGWFADVSKQGQGPNDRAIRSYSIPSWCNTLKYPGGREDPAIKRAEAGRSPQKFLERFGAEFCSPKGLVPHTFRYDLHVDAEVEYDPSLPVYIGIDPGGIVYSVLFVQFTDGQEIHILDELYCHRWTHEAVISEFRGHWLTPAVIGGSIDVASKQPQNAMPIAYDEWYKETSLTLWAQKHAVEDTVERVLWALAPNPNTGRARTKIHPRCSGIISEMGGGASPVPDGGAWMRYESNSGIGAPMRKNDHSCKALGYLLAGPYSYLASERAQQQRVAVSYLGETRRSPRQSGGNSASYI